MYTLHNTKWLCAVLTAFLVVTANSAFPMPGKNDETNPHIMESQKRKLPATRRDKKTSNSKNLHAESSRFGSFTHTLVLGGKSYVFGRLDTTRKMAEVLQEVYKNISLERDSLDKLKALKRWIQTCWPRYVNRDSVPDGARAREIYENLCYQISGLSLTASWVAIKLPNHDVRQTIHSYRTGNTHQYCKNGESWCDLTGGSYADQMDRCSLCTSGCWYGSFLETYLEHKYGLMANAKEAVDCALRVMQVISR